MQYGSVCSGIEAATVAWHSLGWEPSWFSEIEKYPSQVLAHHYPKVSNLGDMSNIEFFIEVGLIDAPDILVGGTPCQAFSVAGLRQSLNDERGQLSLEFVRILDAIDRSRAKENKAPALSVWENVPGVLNTKDNAFGCFLGALSGEECELQPPGGRWKNAGCVFGPQRQVAWRVLDAQYFGLAQRRKRVFVVASARAESIAEILFERKGLCGNPTQSGREKKDNSTTVAKCLTRRGAGGLNQDPETANFVGHGTQDPIVNDDLAHCLGRNRGQENAIYACSATKLNAATVNTITKSYGSGGADLETKPLLLTTTDIAATLTRGFGDRGVDADQIANGNCAIHANRVRRLTPLECERLQGFPDNYTNVLGISDSARYAALGNSMAVNVMQWIGIRLKRYLNGEFA